VQPHPQLGQVQTLFRTNKHKIYTPISGQRGQKPYPAGDTGTYPYRPYRGVPFGRHTNRVAKEKRVRVKIYFLKVAPEPSAEVAG